MRKIIAIVTALIAGGGLGIAVLNTAQQAHAGAFN